MAKTDNSNKILKIAVGIAAGLGISIIYTTNKSIKKEKREEADLRKRGIISPETTSV